MQYPPGHYAVANMGTKSSNDFVFDATVSKLESHIWNITSFSDMNTLGMPMAGVLEGWSTEESGVVSLLRLYDKVQVVWGFDDSVNSLTYKPTSVTVNDFSYTNMNTVLKPFGSSTVASGQSAGTPESYTDTEITFGENGSDTKLILYMPENMYPNTTAILSGDSKAPTIHLDFSFTFAELNNTTIGMKDHSTTFCPYYLDDSGTKKYAAKRNVLITIQGCDFLTDIDPVIITPWDSVSYVAQKPTFSLKVKNEGNIDFSLGSSDESSFVVTKVSQDDTSDPGYSTITGTIACRKPIADGKIELLAGSNVVAENDIVIKTPIMKYNSTVYSLSNSSRETAFSYVFLSEKGDTLNSTFDSDLYDELLNPQSSIVTTSDVKGKVVSRNSEFVFALATSYNITSTDAKTYENAAVAKVMSADTKVADTYTNIELQKPEFTRDHKPIYFGLTLNQIGEANVYELTYNLTRANMNLIVSGSVNSETFTHSTSMSVTPPESTFYTEGDTEDDIIGIGSGTSISIGGGSSSSTLAYSMLLFHDADYDVYLDELSVPDSLCYDAFGEEVSDVDYVTAWISANKVKYALPNLSSIYLSSQDSIPADDSSTALYEYTTTFKEDTCYLYNFVSTSIVTETEDYILVHPDIVVTFVTPVTARVYDVVSDISTFSANCDDDNYSGRLGTYKGYIEFTIDSTYPGWESGSFTYQVNSYYVSYSLINDGTVNHIEKGNTGQVSGGTVNISDGSPQTFSLMSFPMVDPGQAYGISSIEVTKDGVTYSLPVIYAESPWGVIE